MVVVNEVSSACDQLNIKLYDVSTPIKSYTFGVAEDQHVHFFYLDISALDAEVHSIQIKFMYKGFEVLGRLALLYVGPYTELEHLPDYSLLYSMDSVAPLTESFGGNVVAPNLKGIQREVTIGFTGVDSENIKGIKLLLEALTAQQIVHIDSMGVVASVLSSGSPSITTINPATNVKMQTPRDGVIGPAAYYDVSGVKLRLLVPVAPVDIVDYVEDTHWVVVFLGASRVPAAATVYIDEIQFFASTDGSGSPVVIDGAFSSVARRFVVSAAQVDMFDDDIVTQGNLYISSALSIKAYGFMFLDPPARIRSFKGHFSGIDIPSTRVCEYMVLLSGNSADGPWRHRATKDVYDDTSPVLIEDFG